MLLPEGATARDLALTLEHDGLGPAPTFLALARDGTFARSLGVAADGLEGYLFPDTYFFSPLDSAQKILGMFVARFHQMFTPDFEAEARKAGFTVHQIVTLASVIEKETGREDEQPLVSAVFRNRLRHGMPLQADPTVIYGIENFDGNLTRQDLETPTPYNTYTAPGLPRRSDREPRALGVAGRASAGRRAVPLLRRARRRLARVQLQPRRAQSRRESLPAVAPRTGAGGLKRDVHPTDPYRLIAETAVRWRRRRLWDASLPALPPALALLGAGWLGILPVELAAAGVIGFALLGLHLESIELSPAGAARFLDGALRAEDRFLTLATARADESLLPVVAAEAATLAAAPPELPPRSGRPLADELSPYRSWRFCSLWSLPQLPSLGATEGSDLERIAAELAMAGDASLASTLRDVSRTLRDPGTLRRREASKDRRSLAEARTGRTERWTRNQGRLGRRRRGRPGARRAGRQRRKGQGSGSR